MSSVQTRTERVIESAQKALANLNPFEGLLITVSLQTANATLEFSQGRLRFPMHTLSGHANLPHHVKCGERAHPQEDIDHTLKVIVNTCHVRARCHLNGPMQIPTDPSSASLAW